MTIGILDYGAGNLHNLCRALTHIGSDFILIENARQLPQANKLIIPGVGAFKVAMDQLKQAELIEPIQQVARDKMPILGICLGMQMLFEKSTEFGTTKGLGLLKGDINRIPEPGDQAYKIPHIGWNRITGDNECLPNGMQMVNDSYMYFVHSYMAEVAEPDNLLAWVNYQSVRIPAIVGNQNVIGCQFHPEKSGECGLNLLREFSRCETFQPTS